MFTNQLPSFAGLYTVSFSDFSTRHYRKDFAKKYPGRRWTVTESSIVRDLERIHIKLQLTQQVDQMYRRDNCWIFKYDFAVAQSGVSSKASGNRCICYLDDQTKSIEILWLYHKRHVPGKMGEQTWINQILQAEFAGLFNRCR